ncbi:ABC transporter ATP-binding protein [Aquiluna borgnonia]|uniref:ABC transporter ATP-binding protein n=1 Tax=Aquiluna borgnonia TaxID=2499157 RepID=A0A7D4UAD9_9MICO|nr:ABC transporter ATP-binding protein [Aquiluna borgnonia]QKJ24857.1 ABC transporter ATP-binding protein [Aquiluna borgnonia]
MKLELRGITKRFGQLVANDHIDLTVNPGEIHALLGENGAGKSTLMNVLYGLYTADEGQILLDDKVQKFSGPGDAMAAGIGMVHQHFMLIPVFTVAENVALGNEPTSALGTLNLAKARARVIEISDRFGFNVDPDALVEDLPVGVQQRVEIIKALSRDAKVLVLDEPTAVLTPQETDELMAIMRQLAKSGTSIVFITHKLREVKEVADRITVIRLGKVVGSASPEDSTSELASMMVGREVDLTVSKKSAEPGAEVIRLENINVLDDRNQRAVRGVSLKVHAGEILAIAGVQGNGQTELAEALLGLRPVMRGMGAIAIKDQYLKAQPSVREVLEMGVGFIPEDRKKDGLVSEFSVAENLMLDASYKSEFTKGLSINFSARKRIAKDLISRFDVRTPSAEALAGKLSGGNQQKVVVARELYRNVDLLIASQPTRGVDVGSIEFIHEQIVAERDAGKAVILISTELDEVLALADRIAVMYRGEIVGIVPPTTSREQLGKMMAGVSA